MEHDDQRVPFWRSRFCLGWIVLAGVAGWFLWEEHRAHLLGAFPFLFLLACLKHNWAVRLQCTGTQKVPSWRSRRRLVATSLPAVHRRPPGSQMPSSLHSAGGC